MRVSGWVNVDKTKESCRCFVCNCYYFLTINFRFQPMQKAMSFNKLAIVSFKGNYYRINFGTRVKMKP